MIMQNTHTGTATNTAVVTARRKTDKKKNLISTSSSQNVPVDASRFSARLSSGNNLAVFFFFFFLGSSLHTRATSNYLGRTIKCHCLAARIVI